MLDSSLDPSLANVWECLAEAGGPITAVSIHKKTGTSMGKILSALRILEEVDLARKQNKDENKNENKNENEWSLSSSLSALDYARAVEVGVPLSCIEGTVGLSVQEKKKAEKAIHSGAIDKERLQRQQKKLETRKNVIRGRAATRAAATDLARIVQDAQSALAGKPSAVNSVFCSEAERALEALIRAMEK